MSIAEYQYRRGEVAEHEGIVLKFNTLPKKTAQPFSRNHEVKKIDRFKFFEKVPGVLYGQDSLEPLVRNIFTKLEKYMSLAQEQAHRAERRQIEGLPDEPEEELAAQNEVIVIEGLPGAGKSNLAREILDQFFSFLVTFKAALFTRGKLYHVHWDGIEDRLKALKKIAPKDGEPYDDATLLIVSAEVRRILKEIIALNTGFQVTIVEKPGVTDLEFWGRVKGRLEKIRKNKRAFESMMVNELEEEEQLRPTNTEYHRVAVIPTPSAFFLLTVRRDQLRELEEQYLQSADETMEVDLGQASVIEKTHIINDSFGFERFGADDLDKLFTQADGGSWAQIEYSLNQAYELLLELVKDGHIVVPIEIATVLSSDPSTEPQTEKKTIEVMTDTYRQLFSRLNKDETATEKMVEDFVWQTTSVAEILGEEVEVIFRKYLKVLALTGVYEVAFGIDLLQHERNKNNPAMERRAIVFNDPKFLTPEVKQRLIKYFRENRQKNTSETSQ